VNTSQCLRVGALASAFAMTLACNHSTEVPAQYAKPYDKGTAYGTGSSTTAVQAPAGEVGAERGSAETAARQTQAPAQQRVKDEKVYALECGNQRNITLLTDDEFAYMPSEMPAALPRSEVGEDETAAFELGGARVLLNGDRAIVSLASGERLECTNNEERANWEDARLRGVTFRGVGNDPTFLLEIDDSNVNVVTEGGQNRFVFTKPEPQVDEGTSLYHGSAAQKNITVTIKDESCVDSFTKQELSSKVRVDVDATTYEGCGRSPQP
jgi:uncharacterized membrane protein